MDLRCPPMRPGTRVDKHYIWHPNGIPRKLGNKNIDVRRSADIYIYIKIRRLEDLHVYKLYIPLTQNPWLLFSFGKGSMGRFDQPCEKAGGSIKKQQESLREQ